MNTLLFYDISELGWVRYLSAHLNYLKRKGKKVAICTNKSREVFYRGFVDEILPIPQSYYDLFGSLQSDGNCLYDPNTNEIISDHNIISKPFKEAYPDYEVIIKYTNFRGERIFEPYKQSDEADDYCRKFKNSILVFPRNRQSKFSRRNISEEKWIEIISSLCEKYKDLDIISLGGISATFNINLSYENYYNLVPLDDNLDILVSLCNSGKVISTIGTESGIMLVSVICKANCFIIGENKPRIFAENWTDAKIYCWETSEKFGGYDIKDFEKMKLEIFRIVDIFILLKDNMTL